MISLAGRQKIHLGSLGTDIFNYYWHTQTTQQIYPFPPTPFIASHHHTLYVILMLNLIAILFNLASFTKSVPLPFKVFDWLIFFRFMIWSWNRDSTWKRKHLFPVWSILLSGCSYLLQNPLGRNTKRWSRNAPRVVTSSVYYATRGSLTSPLI